MITSAQYSSNTNGNPAVTLPQIETMVTNAKTYADSPQRKAVLERLNIPAEKGEQ